MRVVELGPGKGTLLSDVLRVRSAEAYRIQIIADLPFLPQTFRSLPKHSSPPVTSIHLIENSDALRAEQKKKLQAGGFGDIPVSWWGSVDEVPACESVGSESPRFG